MLQVFSVCKSPYFYVGTSTFIVMTQAILTSTVSGLNPTPGLYQTVSFAIHTRGHCIDLEITRQNDIICDATSPGWPCVSDHHAVFSFLFATKPSPISNIVNYRN